MLALIPLSVSVYLYEITFHVQTQKCIIKDGTDADADFKNKKNKKSRAKWNAKL